MTLHGSLLMHPTLNGYCESRFQSLPSLSIRTPSSLFGPYPKLQNMLSCATQALAMRSRHSRQMLLVLTCTAWSLLKDVIHHHRKRATQHLATRAWQRREVLTSPQVEEKAEPMAYSVRLRHAVASAG